jgi:hypothetical protein
LDATNSVRLNLSLLNGNFPVLGISQQGQDGPPSIEMTASEGVRSVKLHDVAGHPLFTVFAADDGATTLTLQHPQHDRSLQIMAGPSDRDGPRAAFFAPAHDDGSGGMLPQVQLGFDEQSQPFVSIAD